MRFIGRLIWVAIAFILAGLVAAAVAAVVGLELITRNTAGIESLPAEQAGREATRAIDALFAALPLLSGLTILPGLAVVIAGEVMRIRSLVFYLVGGGLASAAMPWLMHVNAGVGSEAPAVAATTLQTLAVAGFAAGALYWLLAGRKA